MRKFGDNIMPKATYTVYEHDRGFFIACDDTLLRTIRFLTEFCQTTPAAFVEDTLATSIHALLTVMAEKGDFTPEDVKMLESGDANLEP